jgi:hypothetical protein
VPVRRLYGLTLLAGIAIVVIAGVYVLGFDRPTPPPSLAGEAAFARTTLQSPDPLESLDPGATSWIVASDCPSRVLRGTAYVDLCWNAARQRDEDASQDYFTLEISGTFGGGARWLIIEAHPLDPGPLLRTEGLPRGRSTGCHAMTFDSGAVLRGAAEGSLCGRLDAGPGAYAGVWHVNWTCEPCLPLDETDRPIRLQLEVVVEEGTLPNWDLVAGLGR